MEDNQYPDEIEYLTKTLEFMDSEVKRIKRGSPATAAYKETAREIQRINDKTISRYLSMRPRPYLRRVDFLQEGHDEPIKGYIGIGSISNYVYDWTTPYARQLASANPNLVNSYLGPEGEIHGHITLKRYYDIEDAQLVSVIEAYRSLPSSDGLPAIADSSESFLINRLAKVRGGELRETVSTLQEEQYKLIAEGPDQVMVVQGVAGSGKSIIGLHRVAFLLSPFNERSEKITANRVVFFGPTRTFLNYVANLLPSLEVRSVQQRTVIDWLRSTFSKQVFLDRREPLLERLLKHKGKRFQDEYWTAAMKGSREMRRTFEMHVQIRRKQFLASTTSVAVQINSAAAIIIDNAQARRVVRSVPNAALNDQRKQVIDKLIEALWDQYRRRNPAVRGTTSQGTQSEFEESVRPQLEQQVELFWPELDFRQEFRQLLSDAKTLAAASKNRLGQKDSTVLTASLPKKPNVFQLEDMGALAYLDHLLSGHRNSRFEHVVLDEAQEVSPLELSVIRQHSRGDGFTILGDLNQSLAPQGIHRWDEVRQLFRGSTISQHVARVSYRSTYEITKYANTVLRKANPKAVLAKPFQRHGPPPKFSPAHSYADMLSAISADIEELIEQGAITIGVLTKTVRDAKKMRQALHNNGTKDIAILDHESVTSESVIVAPIYLTRGLEFDAVVLAGASKDHFPDLPLHTKLLYLAVSRAAHQLRIHWFGQPPTQLGVNNITRRKKTKIITKRKPAPNPESIKALKVPSIDLPVAQDSPTLAKSSITDTIVESHNGNLISQLKAMGLEVEDRRSSGGALWVIGGAELTSILQKFQEQEFKQPSGRATRYQPGWFTHWDG